MEVRIEILKEKKLAGKRLTMSLTKNRTGELWENFMPRRSEITNTISNVLFSMQDYNPGIYAGEQAEFLTPS